MLKKLFGFKPGEHSVKIEILAGITTFLTMAYILAVNPGIFSVLDSGDNPMDNQAVFTATALAAIIGTVVMAFWAKKPFGLAPGMGLNAFFVFTVCLGMGKSWQFALTAILIEGIIFVLLTVTNLRSLIVKSIPATIKKAMGVGIGLYIAFIGMQNCGLVENSDATLVTMGNLTNPVAILALIGLLITGVLVVLRVKGAMLIGIIATTLIGIPMGVTQFGGVINVPPSIESICFKFEWENVLTLDMLIIVFTFLCCDLFDTIGTVVGLSVKTGMVDKDGNPDRMNQIFMADAIATTAGACVGASTTTTYLESAAGVGEGGRTGLTAFVIAICFALSLFFSPIFLAVPSAATSPVLILVGVMMMTPVAEINFKDMSEAIPAFFTIVLMPLFYSISDGIMIGIIAYVVFNALCFKFKKISIMMWALAVLFILRYVVKYAF